MNSDYYKQHEVRDRGWTRNMILKLLGEPDFVKPLNGCGRCCFYKKSRVHAAEASPEFAAAREKNKRGVSTILAAVASKAARAQVAAVRRNKALDLAIKGERLVYDDLGEPNFVTISGLNGTRQYRWDGEKWMPVISAP